MRGQVSAMLSHDYSDEVSIGKMTKGNNINKGEWERLVRIV